MVIVRSPSPSSSSSSTSSLSLIAYDPRFFEVELEVGRLNKVEFANPASSTSGSDTSPIPLLSLTPTDLSLSLSPSPSMPPLPPPKNDIDLSSPKPPDDAEFVSLGRFGGLGEESADERVWMVWGVVERERRVGRVRERRLDISSSW
ncbi:hypothetical protein BT69DRAFT_239614 [Atractiella rhizophila]|nr:hypothetical protein BT69DRAFT_239614 [Atractiella rhizophila]